MNLSGITYSEYNLPFKKVYQTSRSNTQSRYGFIIKFSTSGNFVSYGEAAPLPEYGSESFVEARESIDFLVSKFIGIDLPKSFEDIKSLSNSIELKPTVKTALEQGLIELLLQRNISSPTETSFPSEKNIRCNGLITLSDDMDFINKFNALIQEGFSTIKIKIGLQSFAEELKTLKKLNQEYPEVKLRLDVNCGWTFEEAKNNLPLLESLNIEYIEQPVKEITEIKLLDNISSIPLAADESIRSFDEALYIINETPINFLVIKPMLIGGFFRTLDIIDAAKKKNKHVIISSSLETNIGRRFLIFTAAISDSDFAHGLAANNLLEDDPNKDFFTICNGYVPYSSNKYLSYFERESYQRSI